MPKEKPFKKINENFIETGCLAGDGIQLALDSGFTKIISIELSTHYANLCKQRFSQNNNVEIVIGDSYFELENILKKYPTESFTFWLDGHFSGGDTAFGEQEFPILKELETVLKRDKQNEIVYTDDMRLLRNYDKNINLEKINEIITKYKPQAHIEFESDSYDEKDILIIQY
jgi:hypothetical protein